MTYRDVRKRLTEDKAPEGDTPPCQGCGRATPRETLVSYGGRCGACYPSYCRQVPAAPEVPKFPHGPRSWAQRLQWREQHGERLTPMQASAWRAALASDQEAA